MSLHDDLEDALELAKTVISDKKAEKEKAEQERKSEESVRLNLRRQKEGSAGISSSGSLSSLC